MAEGGKSLPLDSITRAIKASRELRNSETFYLPIYEYFHRKLLDREFAMADETPWQVLHKPERRVQTKSYLLPLAALTNQLTRFRHVRFYFFG